jgi:hypothetical protein
MQPHTVRHDPRQLVTDLARSNSTNDGQAVKLDRALSPVPQLNVDVGKKWSPAYITTRDAENLHITGMNRW